MRERIRARQRGLHISLPGLVSASFLDQIAQSSALPERQYDLPTKLARVNGTSLHYFEFGEGAPVVFVHGTIGDYRSWGNQFEALSARYKVISYSRRYHYPNAWTGDGSDYTSGLHADDLAAFIETLGLGAAHLVGVSSGASIAVECASRHPEVVRSVTANEPDWVPWLVALGHQDLIDQWVSEVERPTVDALAAGDLERALAIFVDGCVGPGTWAGLSPEMHAVMLDNVPELRVELQYASSYFSPFSFDDARRIKAPVLLIEGGASLPMYKPTAAKLLECVSHAERVIVEGASHAVHLVAPDRFSETLLAFLHSVDQPNQKGIRAHA